MSFRNDHDAALARVDALESELATLRKAFKAERARETISLNPASVPRARTPWILGIALVAVASGTAVGAGVLLRGGPNEPAVDESSVAAPASFDPILDNWEVRWDLRACRDAITKIPGATSSGASCRPLLHLHDSHALDPNVRGQVAMWARAEDELAGLITRLQSGSTPELWSDYDRAVSARDAVLADLDL
jgi:hypothetical protein